MHVYELWHVVVMATLLRHVTSHTDPVVNMTCDGSGLNVELQGIDFAQYEGAPYAQGYRYSRHCMMAFENILDYSGGNTMGEVRFTLSYSEVVKGDCGSITTGPNEYSGDNATVFQVTLVLPRSAEIFELPSDYQLQVQCKWTEEGAQWLEYNETSIFRETELDAVLHDSIPPPSLQVHLLARDHDSSERVVHLGDRLAVFVTWSNTFGGFWNTFVISSLVAYNQENTASLVLVYDGCILNDEHGLKVGGNFVRKLHLQAVFFNAFRFQGSEFVKFRLQVHICRAKRRRLCVSPRHCRPPMSENGKLLSRDRRMLPQLMARITNMSRDDAHAARRRREVNAYASGVETAEGASDLAVDMNLDLQMQIGKPLTLQGTPNPNANTAHQPTHPIASVTSSATSHSTTSLDDLHITTSEMSAEYAVCFDNADLLVMALSLSVMLLVGVGALIFGFRKFLRSDEATAQS